MLVRPSAAAPRSRSGPELMKTYGVDSLIGRTAAVMLGSSETTFYTISVYFGSAGISDTRHTPSCRAAAQIFVGLFHGVPRCNEAVFSEPGSGLYFDCFVIMLKSMSNANTKGVCDANV